MNNSRVWLVTFLLGVGFFMITANLFKIQVVHHEDYKLQALRQQDRKADILAERGMICDRASNPLVYTENDYSVYADVKNIKNDSVRNVVAGSLSSVFGKAKEYYLPKLTGEGRRVLIEKKAKYEKVLNLRHTGLKCFNVEPDYSRVYAFPRLASHVLGYTNGDQVGMNGVEKEFNDYLTGKNGALLIEADVLGNMVAIDENNSSSAIPGNKVFLTINKEYQKILEEELSAGLTKYQGTNATGIIMNPNTGEILAMANIPDYDPADYGSFDDFKRKNRAIVDTYEPGSTIKPIVMALLLKDKLAKLDEVIYTENGKYHYKNVNISDTHPASRLTVRNVLTESSNIGMVKLSERIDKKSFYLGLRDFGFGNRTDVDLPGETGGFMKKPSKYSKVSKAFISHGYEISASPLQIVSAYSALINGGTLYKPYSVLKVEDENGRVVMENSPQKIRDVISSEISDTIKAVLKDAVENGTGVNAKLHNVYVGGKTGTAQRWTGDGYSRSEHNTSFVGFFPVDDPQVVVFILVNYPKVGKYGGSVAAPIFKRTASRMIEANLNLVPDKYRIYRNDRDPLLLVEEFEGAGDQDVSNYGNPKNSVEEEEETSLEDILNDGVMPNLKGYSKREAMTVLAELGVICVPQGQGHVYQQTIKPGTKIVEGTTCYIKCRINYNMKE